MSQRATWGNTSVGQETEETRGKYGQEPSLWLLWEGTVKAG